MKKELENKEKFREYQRMKMERNKENELKKIMSITDNKKASDKNEKVIYLFILRILEKCLGHLDQEGIMSQVL